MSDIIIPISRIERYLAQIAENTAGGGGSSVTVEQLNVSSNNTYTAPTGKAYSPVVVNVPNTYSAGDEGKVVSNGALVSQSSDTVTQNGTVDTTLINSLLVNVSGGGGGLEYEEGTWTPNADTTKGTITFANQHTKAPFAFAVIDTSDPSTLTGSAILCMRYFDCYRAFGVGYNAGKSGGVKYSTITVIEASANASSFQTFNHNTTANSDSSFSSTSNYPKWWCTNTEIHVCDGDTNGNCKAGRSYKWIAVFAPES